MWHLSCFCHLFEVWACPILNIPAEMSVDLKQHIVDWYLVDQYTYRQIAELASCSIGHVSNVMRNFWEFAQVKNPFSSHTGHPSQIEEGEVYLNALLAANPALYLDELQTSLLSVHNINLSIATISWILTQYELTQKQLHKVAAEQDEELRGIWEADMAQYQDADVIRHWQWCHGWQAERVCADAIFKRASCREGQWVLHLMKHEHTCGKMIVDRDNTISNLLRVRLGYLGQVSSGASVGRTTSSWKSKPGFSLLWIQWFGLFGIMGNDGEKDSPVDLLIYTNPSLKLVCLGSCSSPVIAISFKNDHRVIRNLWCHTRKLAIGWGRNLAGHEGCRTEYQGILRLGYTVGMKGSRRRGGHE